MRIQTDDFLFPLNLRAPGRPSDATATTKASLFTLAILSGSKDAVAWVSKFVTDSLGDDPDKRKVICFSSSHGFFSLARASV